MAISEQEFQRIFKQANSLWETDFFQKHGTAAIQKFMDDAAGRFACELHRSMCDMESPLEAAFFAWFRVHSHETGSFYLQPQVEVSAGGNSYRLDFVARVSEFGSIPELAGSPVCPKIAIELDGHDYHEKTKAQVIHRNRRDRDLQADGWVVLHVSGSEFNAAPEKVAAEIYRRVMDLMFAAYRKLVGRE